MYVYNTNTVHIINFAHRKTEKNLDVIASKEDTNSTHYKTELKYQILNLLLHDFVYSSVTKVDKSVCFLFLNNLFAYIIFQFHRSLCMRVNWFVHLLVHYEYFG